MKYSLRDFGRAAGRHVDGMELSPSGRDRLTRPRRRRPSALSWAGWAAAACLVIMLMLSLPLSAPDISNGTASPTHGALAAQAPGTPEASALPAPTEAAPATPRPTASAPRATDVAARSQALAQRADMRFVRFDNRGYPYVLNDYDVYSDYTEAALSAYYTEEEVRSSPAGREYYAHPGAEFDARLWPRPECVTFLPVIEGADWQYYYLELGVGIVTRYVPPDGGADAKPYALADLSGLRTDYLFSEINYFTVDGRAAAALPSASSDWGVQRWGFIDADGGWVSEPIMGRMDTIYMNDGSEDGESRLTYYALQTCPAVDEEGYPEYGVWRIYDPSGRELFTAADISQLTAPFSSELTPFRAEADGPWGYIDQDLNIAIPPMYESADAFSEGLAAVGVRTEGMGILYGYIGARGEMVIEPQFYMVDWFGFSEGTTRVRYGWDDVWHTIDTQGNDVTSGFSLAWQRLRRFIDSLPLDMRLMYAALLCLLFTLNGVRRARGYREGADAPRLRGRLGWAALLSLMLGWAALPSAAHSPLPGWLLLTGLDSDMHTYAVAGILLMLAAACGFIYGWSARERCQRRWTRLTVIIATPALLVGARWLPGASTYMDIDIALVLMTGALAGSTRPAYGQYEVRGFATRWLCPLMCVLMGLIALGYSAWDWNGRAAVSGAEYSLSPLNDPANLQYYSELRDDPPLSEEDMALQYGEDWRERLDALLDAPEGLGVLTLEVRLTNFSLRPVRDQFIWLRYAELADADPTHALRGRMRLDINDWAYVSPAPFASENASFRFIIDMRGISDGAWLGEAVDGYARALMRGEA